MIKFLKKYIDYLIRLLTLSIYNNTRSFRENYILNQEYKKLRATSKIKMDPTILEIGFKITKIKLSASLPNLVDQEFKDVELRPNSPYIDLDISKRKKISKKLLETVNQLKATSEELLGTKTKIHWLVVNRLWGSKSNIACSSHWHADNCPVKSLKAMVLLTPVNDKTGGHFEIMTRKNSRHMRKYGFFPDHPFVSRADLDKVISINKNESKYFAGDVGDVIWFDNNILHRGNVLSSHHNQPRDTIIIQFYPSNANNYNDYVINDQFDISTAPKTFLHENYLRD